MKHSIAIIGIPATGKSTILNSLLNAGHHTTRCSDFIKQELGEIPISQFQQQTMEFQDEVLENLMKHIQKLSHHALSFYDSHANLYSMDLVSPNLGLIEANYTDRAILLHPSAEFIQANILKDIHRKRPLDSSIEAIQLRLDQEKHRAQEWCTEFNIPLHIITSEDIEGRVQDIITVCTSMKPMNLNDIQAELDPFLEDFKVPLVLLLDADKTLSYENGFKLVDTKLGLRDTIFQMFQKYGYDPLAFLKTSELIGTIHPDQYYQTIQEVGDTIALQPEIQNLLLNLPSDIPVIIITAGMPQLWEYVLKKNGLHHIKVIGGIHPTMDKFLVTPNSKGLVAQYIKDQGRYLIGFGDSLIDVEILEKADLSIVATDKKLNSELTQNLTKPFYFLKSQFDSPKSHTLDSRQILNYIQSKLKPHNLFEISQDHPMKALVESSRKSQGHELRQQHRVLGEHIGQFFQSKFNKDFSTLAIMRSGLHIALGADQTQVTPHSYYYTPIAKLQPFPDGCKSLLVIDSVVDTGRTLEALLPQLKHSPLQITFACITARADTIQRLALEYPKINFLYLRKSHQSKSTAQVQDMGDKLNGTH